MRSAEGVGLVGVSCCTLATAQQSETRENTMPQLKELREGRPPRYNSKDIATLLVIPERDVSWLVHEGLLQPLGHPKPNAPKYFAADEVERLVADKEWLSRATDALYAHHQEMNARRGPRPKRKKPQPASKYR